MVLTVLTLLGLLHGLLLLPVLLSILGPPPQVTNAPSVLTLRDRVEKQGRDRPITKDLQWLTEGSALTGSPKRALHQLKVAASDAGPLPLSLQWEGTGLKLLGPRAEGGFGRLCEI